VNRINYGNIFKPLDKGYECKASPSQRIQLIREREEEKEKETIQGQGKARGEIGSVRSEMKGTYFWFKIQKLNKEGMEEGVKSKVSKVHEGYLFFREYDNTFHYRSCTQVLFIKSFTLVIITPLLNISREVVD